MRSASRPAADATSPVQPGRGRDHLDADAVLLHGFHHRPGCGLPEWRPGDHRGQFTAHRHERLQHQLTGRRQIQPGRLARRADDPYTAAVIPAAGDLDHARPAVGVAERDDPLRPCGVVGGQHLEGRHRHAELGQPGPHEHLVLRVLQRVGPRIDGVALGDQGADVLARHVLVVEGDDVAAVREPAQGVQVGVVADHHVGSDQGGAVVGGHRQHPQGLAERDRGLVRHPGELTAADHPDPGHAGAFIHGRYPRENSLIGPVRGAARRPVRHRFAPFRPS